MDESFGSFLFHIQFMLLCSSFRFMNNREDQIMVERMLVKREVNVLVRFVRVNFHDIANINGKSCHDGILVFLN